MRLLPSPVVVCTAGRGPGARAMTLSSLTSLALAPLLVTFNVATPSRTLDAMRGRFNIHVLEASAAGAAVADHFSRGLDLSDLDGLARVADGPPELRGDGVLRVLRCRVAELVRMRDRVIVVGEVLGVADGPPELRGDGVLRVLRCRVAELVRVRDRVIVVGEVLGVSGEGGALGLAYADRKYRRLGDAGVIF